MKMTRKMISVLALMMAAALVFTGCASTSKSSTLKLGFAGPLTGASAQDGEAMKNGAQLAVDIVNKAGGIDGKQVEIVFEDDKSDPKEAASIANKYAADKSMLAVIGHFNSSCTLAGAPIYNKAGMVEISGGSSSPAVTDAGEFTFRTITTDAFQGKYVMEWAAKQEGFKTLAVVYENTDYGQGILTIAEEQAAALGLELVAKEAYILGQTKDFSSIVTKLKEAQPDAVLIGGLYNETALLAKQMQRSGFSVPIMGVDGIYSSALIELGGEAVEGIMMTAFFHSSSPSQVTQDFIAAYKAAYNEDPGTYAAYVFDAANILIEAMKSGATDRAAIQAYVAKVQNYEGVTGPISFDENGDRFSDPLQLVVKGGKFELYSK